MAPTPTATAPTPTVTAPTPTATAPTSTENAAMPAAIANSLILPTPHNPDADKIPPALFAELCERIHLHCGIVLKDGKQDLVRARVAKLVRDQGHSDVSTYLRQVLAGNGTDDFHRLVDALSTNLTSFFRESHHFDYLGGQLLPALAQRRRSRGGSLRLRGWSAGCSTGEEPYTIAITVLDAMTAHGISGDFRLLATDISSKVLETAARGHYPRIRTLGVPPRQRQRFFHDLDHDTTAVTDELRNTIIFNYLNLQSPWPFTGIFDFIFCRNVMIYFDRPTQERLVNRFYNILAPGGMFFTGHSESLAGLEHRFRYVQPTIYTK
jgi:chemotaxis protein methyltransferase CheR